MRKRTFIGCRSAYGGSPVAISIAVIPMTSADVCKGNTPKLQISALSSYPDCLITSGDIQYGVPTKVFCRQPETWDRRTFLVMVAVSCPETPKSASFTSPLEVRRIFAAGVSVHDVFDPPLISRCNFPSPWRYSRPLNSSLASIAMYSSPKTPAFICRLAPGPQNCSSPSPSRIRQNSTPL